LTAYAAQSQQTAHPSRLAGNFQTTGQVLVLPKQSMQLAAQLLAGLSLLCSLAGLGGLCCLLHAHPSAMAGKALAIHCACCAFGFVPYVQAALSITGGLMRPDEISEAWWSAFSYFAAQPETRTWAIGLFAGSAVTLLGLYRLLLRPALSCNWLPLRNARLN
jgi:hypothetical protein